ncbi:glycosyltransferase BC10-like [Gastrolobium bilobum]|uniref:glycosyltransferase BC10-like n=1 Tax=Gastrolobium bilobum TaxID=150636 RepID=UPI002AB23FD2|nr:glycosyltransferase BC10-like [Gastrolobium bilobum]
MLSPNPLSLLCPLLLCLPLAIVFTTTYSSSSSSSAANDQNNNTTIPSSLVLEKPTPNLKSSFFGMRNPKNKSKELDDDEEALFRAAAHAKRKATWPRKIAFMFLTTTPLSFAPLWESYFNQTPKNLFNIYIHADPTFSYHPPFSGVFSDRLIPSKPTARFSPTLTSAARRLLARALIHDRSNSIFVLLSSSCIPLHSFNFTYRTLSNSHKSFIEILNNEDGSYDRWAARGPQTMLPEVMLEDFRIGSQFWALTRKHARLVVSDRKLWPKFNLPCLRSETCYPEENYFPTLLSMWDPKGCVHATLTHVDWTGRDDGHPRTYESSEVVPELIQSLRRDRPRYGNGNGENNSRRRRRDPFLFARKFSADSLQPLMRIADGVIFRD